MMNRTPEEAQADLVMGFLTYLEGDPGYQEDEIATLLQHVYRLHQIRDRRDFLGLVHRCPDIETAVLLQDMQTFGGK